MSLSPGDKLGPYEILSPIGAGGMGEVYKARDTRLDRIVALKTSKAEFTERFEREARAVAALNHPNICQHYDVGPNYLVMELVEGQQLKGPLPVENAVEYAKQILDALDAAHRKGITHRDLKPGNILVTKQGIKLLDFGLAKHDAPLKQTDATETKALTGEGQILGTLQYMSPEQLQAKPTDARSDIFAFGCVLYEIIGGNRAFQGQSTASVIAAILEREPAPLNVNPPLEKVIRKCLAKDPDDRFQNARDLKYNLAQAMEQQQASVPKANRWPWAVAVVCLLFAVAAGTTLLRKPNQLAQPVKLDVNPPESSRFGATNTAGGSAISPDGRTLAFVATNAKGESLLHLRPLESLEARALPGTEDAGPPFWSPDSKSLTFVAAGKLKRIDVAGGSPITLCDARLGRGGTWNDDGVILFGDHAAGLQRIPASGGTPSPVTRLNQEAGETSHYYPQFLPGGKEFLYLVRPVETEKMAIFVGSLDGKPATRIVQTEYKAVYDAVAGRLLYILGDGTLMARRMELDPRRLTGDPAVVAEQVGLVSANGFADFSVSGNGTLFYGRGRNVGKSWFGWQDRAGKLLETIGQPFESTPTPFSLSPDGSRVAYAAGPRQPDVWVLELARGLSTRITFSNAKLPQWSADGKQLYYRNPSGVHRKAADGSGEEELVMKGTFGASPQSVSPDGKYLLYGFDDIMTLPLTGERKPEPYLQTKYSEFGATFPPDGRWVAYTSNESGRHEIYIQGFPERRGKWLVSSAGGIYPQWRADGKELYWTGLDNTLVAAGVELQAAGVNVGRAEPLFRLPGFGFQPARDGRRFLVLEPEGGQQPDRPMVVIQNWAAGISK